MNKLLKFIRSAIDYINSETELERENRERRAQDTIWEQRRKEAALNKTLELERQGYKFPWYRLY